MMAHAFRTGGAAVAARALTLEAARRWQTHSADYRDDITVVVVFLNEAAEEADAAAKMRKRE